MFSYDYTVKIRDTDVSGRLFFTSHLTMAHEAFEALLEKSGFSILDIFRENRIHLPIVHAEADYTQQTRAGEKIRISVACSEIGTTSFSMTYTFNRLPGGECTGSAKTVHVAVNPAEGVKTTLPAALRSVLESCRM